MPEISGSQRRPPATTLGAQEALQHAAGSEQLGADISGLYAAGGSVQVADLPGAQYADASCQAKRITLDTALHRQGTSQNVTFALASAVGFMRTDCARAPTESLDSYLKGRAHAYAQMLAYGFRIQQEMGGTAPGQTLERGDGVQHMKQLHDRHVRRLGEAELIAVMAEALPSLMPHAMESFRNDFRNLTGSALSDREKDEIARAAGDAARKAVHTAVRSSL
jgi:hypothetical protein